MGTEIKELYNALQRFIERRQKMHIPLEQDDDDIMIANAFDELEQLRTENERLREAGKEALKKLQQQRKDEQLSRALCVVGFTPNISASKEMIPESREEYLLRQALKEGGSE